MLLHVLPLLSTAFCVKILNFLLVLSLNEFDALKDVGAKMAALTPEDLQKMRAENWYGEHRAFDKFFFFFLL